MTTAPTYEELEKQVLHLSRQVQDLENQLARQRQSEAELRQDEQWYRLLAENANDVIWTMNLDLELTYISPSVKRVRGFTPEEALQQSLAEALPPQSLEKVINDFKEKKAQGPPPADTPVRHFMELEYYRKDGSTVWVENSVTPMKDADGTVIGLFGISRDITARKKAETALRQSEAKYRLLAENANDVIWTADMGLNLTYVSPSDERLRGFSAQEVLNMTVKESLTPDSYQHALAVFEKGLAQENNGRAIDDPSFLELEFRCKDGSTIWTEVSMTWLRDDQGQPEGIIGVSRDITDRKKTEAALRQSEEKYRLLAENANDVIWTMDLNLQLTYVSPSIQRLRGLSPEEVMQQPLSEGLTPDSMAAVLEALQEVQQQEAAGQPIARPVVLETQYIHQDGSTVWVENSTSPLRNETGEIVGIFGISRDISDRKEAEKKLRQSEEKYRLLAENANDIIWTTDLDLQLTYVSPSVHRIRGVTPEESLAENMVESFAPESFQRVTEMFEEAWACEINGDHVTTPYVVEVEQYNTAGDSVWMEISATWLRDEQGRPTGVIGVSRDITDRKMAEKGLRESEKRLARARRMESIGVLAGGVAHDLNNILSGILSYPDLLLLDLPADSSLRRPLETIRDSGERAAGVVSDLLTIARGVATQKEIVRLNDLVDDYAHCLEHQDLQERYPSVCFEVVLTPDPWHISCSPLHVKKALMNLVINAAESVSGLSTVEIRTQNRRLKNAWRGYDTIPVGEYAVLSVSDNGSGITEEDLERIFEPFYSKKVMGRSGTGLGLAVIRNTVQDHKGYIDVISSPDGTTFELYFPVTQAPLTEKDESVCLDQYLGRQEKVLVVDDEAIQRDVACELLNKLGYQAEAVSSGEAALEYLAEKAVDLVLLDMIMPNGLNGCQTYEKIVARHPGQKAIIASGYSRTQEVDRALEAGPAVFLEKPYTIKQIGVLLHRQLREAI